MKKLLFGASLLFSLGVVNAQDLKKVSNAYLLNKIEDAKTEIDKVTADPKSLAKADVWYWRATIYGAISDDANLSTKYPGAGEMAYTSFKKYAEMDPSFKAMNEAPIPGKAIVDFLYRGNLKAGIAFFDKKQWDSAYKYFTRSADIGDLITKYNWRGNKQAIDTTTVLFSGYAAQNAKKSAEAAKYYSRIADLRITNSPATGEVKDIYEYLAYYYLDTKNNASFQKYIELARSLYPADIDKWADYETDFVEKNYSLADKAAAYAKGDAAGTLTTYQYLSYGNMFYNLKEEEKTGLDSAQMAAYRGKAEEAFIKGYNKDNKNGLAAFNAGLINYNDWVSLDDQYNDNVKKMGELNRSKAAEKDPKKKAANDAKINKQVDALRAENAKVEKIQHAYADKAIIWMENAYKTFSAKSTLERTEKGLIAKSIDDLANLYLWKRDKSKGNNSDYDKYDALYKKYDALHGKY